MIELEKINIKGLFFIMLILLFQNCKTSKISTAENYNSIEIFNKFNAVLKDFAPEFDAIIDGGFSNTEEGLPIGYAIYDLNDPTNFSTLINNQIISFEEGHFYHFSSVNMSASYSHIAYLDKGEIIIFKAVNCLDRGDDFDDLLDFAIKKLKNNPDKDEIIDRIKNYRQFGKYVVKDFHSMNVNCVCSPCE